MRSFTSSFFVLLLLAVGASAQDRVVVSGGVTSLHIDTTATISPSFVAARAMPAPRATEAEDIGPALREPATQPARPRGTKAFAGTGQTWPGLAQRLYRPSNRRVVLDEEPPVFTPSAFGTGRERPYSTALVDLTGNDVSASPPYRAVGRLFFDAKIVGGVESRYCTATLVDRGLLVTAAHCVADNHSGLTGLQQWNSNFRFVPAFHDGEAPYGVWVLTHIEVHTSWLAGDPSVCTGSGVVCTNDIAIATVERKQNRWIGRTTGHLGRSWNGFAWNDHRETHITQIGYPLNHNRGELMVQTGAEARYRGQVNRGNIVWGSSQSGGSSGGPIVANFGRRVSGSTGSASARNRVIGVTSWGVTEPEGARMVGGARFTRDTLVPLVKSACQRTPRPC